MGTGGKPTEGLEVGVHLALRGRAQGAVPSPRTFMPAEVGAEC